mmetsp:Transcript_21922/g.33790  ORF Transcript_21922/g.33790 Transcript_21922/m.33790 type:complete len:422 (-) Transcript_21922:1143-2408(-)|eukprot:CAMPEP_0197320796 /NCGR_PEP_ID=MMETSP0891-20130614/61712_1 /TAXON_ID=44058 ORGANISM="Aureoumbra lagunensis, Strain CCMP1510" /NCGR_SAMPLE_ID=MMETSP0891 /ASSEMBLY_ACC=CAM_ASM_000534 /LENGTH=421 /DNA_ID=CAMNT_0042812347 /DNA_START=30 /DNA_END=1295 /DNA_ORIENTATION=-
MVKGKAKKKATGKETISLNPPPKKKSSFLWKNVASGIMALFAVIYTVMRRTGGNPLVYIEETDEVMLRRVFFSGEVWAIGCADSTTGAPPDNFEAVAVRLKESEINFGVLDCTAKLPSGRSTIQRWKLKSREKPIIFVTNGAQVIQIIPSAARNEYDLIRELRLAAVRRPAIITNANLFQEKCLFKPRCLLILAGSELEHTITKSLDKIMGRFATNSENNTLVAFAELDATSWKLDIEGFDTGDKIKLRRFESGAHRAVYFKNDSLTTIKALAHYRGGFSESSITAFLHAVISDENRLVSLDAIPTIVKRPRPKRPAPPKPDPSSTDDADSKAAQRRKRRSELKDEQIKSKHPDVLTDEDRERLKQQQQREREAKARESMERQAADSAFISDADIDFDIEESSSQVEDSIEEHDDDDIEEI